MPLELLARVLRQDVQDGEVVLGREDRDVTHVGRERREPRLDVGAGAVPEQQGVQAKVKRRSWTRGRRPAAVRMPAIRKRCRINTRNPSPE